MKKLLCIILTLMLLMSLVACGGAPATGTPGSEGETKTYEEKDEAVNPDDTDSPNCQVEDGFSFALDAVSITPGNEFNADSLPEADDVFEIESCAGQGTDTVYCYEAAEITVFNDGSKGVVYSIYLLDPNTATAEGIYLGDEKAQVETAYGTDYEEEETELVYTKGNTQLRIMIEDDIVVAIEYRLITE